MDFELSDDQLALQSAARDLLDAEATPQRVRAVFEAGGAPDERLWQQMVTQGWTALVVPTDLGGLGLGIVELAVLLEQIGAHLAPVPFLQQSVALRALVAARASGVEGLDDWIGEMAAGERIACVAWKPVVARQGAGSWLLSGTPEPAIAAPLATLVVLRAHVSGSKDGGGERDELGPEMLFAAELADPPSPQPIMDRTRQAAWIHLEDQPAVLLGSGDAADAFGDLGAAAHCAEMLGAASRAMDMTVEYAREREQFGRPIGSFQAVKHRCADMLVDVEGMRSAVYYAAWAIGADDPERSVAASTAKTWCSDAARRVMASALQVHGGIGFTWEHDIHMFLKRSQLDQVSFGDASFHRSRLAQLLRQRVLSGESII